MIIKRFVFNDFSVNTYLIVDEQHGKVIIIDPGMSTEKEEVIIDDFIKTNKLKVDKVILTHGHFDHCLGINFFLRQNIPVLINKEDEILLDYAEDMAKPFGIKIQEKLKATDYLTDEQVLTFGKNKLRVIHTPGHSPGHSCIIMEDEKIIFTGDLIFKGSIGRTDLPGGDYNQLQYSIKEKILTLSSDYKLLPGHGQETYLSDELLNNPYIIGIY